jgi:PAS domain S-box-containing protein
MDVAQDISEQQRTEALLRGRNKVLEQIATGVSLVRVLATLVETAQEVNPEMIGSVLLLDREQNRLRSGAAPRLPDFYNAAVDGLPIGPCAGSCGTAAYLRERVIVSDVMQHPYWAAFREVARQVGIGACWSQPIFSSDGEVLGTFAMYYRQPRQPDPRDLEDIETAAHLAGIAISHQRAAEELRLLNRSLETRVEERTCQLQASQEELRRRAQQTRLIVDTAHEAFVGMDAGGQIIDWNPAAEKTFGWSRDEALGRSLADTIIPLQHRQAHCAGLARFLATGEGPVLNQRIEITGLHRDGHEFPLEMTINPLRVGESHVFHAFLHDITIRKQAERELQNMAAELARSNRDLDQFASILSHDLSAPIRVVATYCELLQSGFKERLGAEADEYLQGAVDSAKRMQRLIRDLHAFARVTRQPKALATVNCESVLRDVLANLQMQIQETHATVSHDPLPPVTADATQLMQLFQNLIGNGIKYCKGKSPVVHVGVREQGGAWLFSVQDNGIGIHPDHADWVFQIFHRLHADENEYSGTGIGLAICKRIVEQHGGRIWFESQPGAGCTFLFTLPKAEAPA